MFHCNIRDLASTDVDQRILKHHKIRPALADAHQSIADVCGRPGILAATDYTVPAAPSRENPGLCNTERAIRPIATREGVPDAE